MEKKFLEKLAGNEKFKSLFFSSVYDNRTFAKDRVALLAYVLEDTSDKQMEERPLRPFNKGEVFDNERNYSSYEITKEGIQKLLAPYGREVVYFIFKPVPYAYDKDYVSYEIIPADINKVPLSRRRTEIAAPGPSMNIQNSNTGASGIRNFSEGTAMMTMSREYEVAGTMNPSPPATASFEAEM